MHKLAFHEQHAVLRAAIDFGSGAIKFQLAYVDIQSNRIIRTLFLRYYPLLLTEDVIAHGGCISPGMEQQSLNTLQKIQEEALSQSFEKGYRDNIQYYGIATGVFRKAKNGIDLLQKISQKLKIPFKLLEPDEEGLLGFMTGKALFSDIDEKHLLVWDTGNASFQMSTIDEGVFKIYHGPLGHGTVRALLSKDMRNGSVLLSHESGNPVSTIESQMLTQKILGLIPAIPQWLNNKMASKIVFIATFGESDTLFARIAQAIAAMEGTQYVAEEAVLSFTKVKMIKDYYLGQKDEFFDLNGAHRKTFTCSLLLSTVMEYLGMQIIHYRRSTGNTLGMLIAPQLWE